MRLIHWIHRYLVEKVFLRTKVLYYNMTFNYSQLFQQLSGDTRLLPKKRTFPLTHRADTAVELPYEGSCRTAFIIAENDRRYLYANTAAEINKGLATRVKKLRTNILPWASLLLMTFR